MSNFGFGKTVELDYDAAIQLVTEELAKEGFGILTVIDVQATLKAKLDLDMPPYRILGACNPVLASQGYQDVRELGRGAFGIALLVIRNVKSGSRDGNAEKTYVAKIQEHEHLKRSEKMVLAREVSAKRWVAVLHIVVSLVRFTAASLARAGAALEADQ